MLEIKEGIIADTDATVLSQPLSFTVAEGQCVAIGGSRRAASALLRALLGLQPLAAGHITIDGDALLPLTAAYFRRQMAYVPADISLSTDTVETFVAQLYHLSTNQEVPLRKSILMQQWQQLDLDESIYAQPLGSLTESQQQRVVLSTAGLFQRPITLIDGPTLWQDEATSAIVRRYLRSAQFAHTAMVVATDDGALGSICDQRITIEPPTR